MNLLDQLKNFDIILASQSPRRQQLLKHADIPFRVIFRSTQEHFPSNIAPHEVAMIISKEKSDAFDNELKQPKTIVITADTIVVHNGIIINKPSDNKEAKMMLRALSGAWHKVITGVCIRHKDQQRLFYETTEVKFRDLSEEEISYYVMKYKPHDKAGAYGIQEWIGYVGISTINGSYSNVVGLPVEKVFNELKDLLGIIR